MASTSLPNAPPDTEEEDAMRAALQVAVAQICNNNDNENDDGSQMCQSAIQTLTELTYLYATTSLASDLVAFSLHANRRTITPDDVMLAARKNPDNLLSKLEEFAETMTTTASATTTTISSSAVKKAPSKAKPKKRSPSLEKRQQPPKESRFDRMLRQMETESEGSSDNGNHKTMVQAQRPTNNNIVDSDEDSFDVLQQASTKPSAKRTYNDLEDDDDDDDSDDDGPPISQFRRKSASKKGLKKIQQITKGVLSDDDDPPIAQFRRASKKRLKKSHPKNNDGGVPSDDDSIDF